MLHTTAPPYMMSKVADPSLVRPSHADMAAEFDRHIEGVVALVRKHQVVTETMCIATWNESSQ